MQEAQTKLNPQAIRILAILQDREWHCPISWGYSDGHTKRFTDINRYLESQGLEVIGDWCDCGRHGAKVKKRKIISRGGQTASRWTHNPEKAGSIPAPAPATNLLPMTDKIRKWNEQFRPKAIETKQPQLF